MPQSDNQGRTEVYYQVTRSIKMPDWIEFARGENWLGLPSNIIDDIQHDYSNHISEQKFQMLVCWEQRKGRSATPQHLKDMAHRFLERQRDTITTTDSRAPQQSLPQPIPSTNQPARPTPLDRDTLKFRQLLMKVSNKLTPENVSSLQNMFQLTGRQFTKSDIIFYLEDNEYLGTSAADKLTELRHYMDSLDRNDLCEIIDRDRRSLPTDVVDAQPAPRETETENVETLEGQFEEDEAVASLSSTPSGELTPAEAMVQDLAKQFQKGGSLQDTNTPSGQASVASTLQGIAPLGTAQGQQVHINYIVNNYNTSATNPGNPQAFSNQLPGETRAVDAVDIDVKDMCNYSGLDVSVTPSTKDFFESRKNDSEVYSVKSNPKGNVLILNNIDFPTWDAKYKRSGALKDRVLLAKLFGNDGLGLNVNVEENKTAERMWNLLEKFSKDECHANSDMSVVIIMSHGNFVKDVGDCFYGNYGKYISTVDVIRLFDNDRCQNLRGKPKIFIFQFCRGDVADKGVKTSKDEHDLACDPSTPMSLPKDALSRLLPHKDAADGDVHLPTRSDVLVAYATQQGNLSFRSWFTNAIVNVFSRKAHNKNLCDMLKEVKRGLAERVSSTDHANTHECKEMADIRDVLLKNVYFFPGHP